MVRLKVRGRVKGRVRVRLKVRVSCCGMILRAILDSIDLFG